MWGLGRGGGVRDLGFGHPKAPHHQDLVAFLGTRSHELLGGSFVVFKRATSRVTIIATHIRELITPLITGPMNLQVGIT